MKYNDFKIWYKDSEIYGFYSSNEYNIASNIIYEMESTLLEKRKMVKIRTNC